MYKKFSLLAIIISIALSSCSIFGRLISTTTISPNNSFILGNNEHNRFTATAKNVSKQKLDIFLQPLNGQPKLVQTLLPQETAKLKVPGNTAIIIKNNSTDTVNVQLKVNGDTGLSMGYKN
ncbi:MAG: hypothetical protein ACOVMI_05160 [Chitinophagaceae bacterium]|jgi:hypothetical protein